MEQRPMELLVGKAKVAGKRDIKSFETLIGAAEDERGEISSQLTAETARLLSCVDKRETASYAHAETLLSALPQESKSTLAPSQEAAIFFAKLKLE